MGGHREALRSGEPEPPSIQSWRVYKWSERWSGVWRSLVLVPLSFETKCGWCRLSLNLCLW